MADIRVKPIKRTRIWIWLLVVLILAATGTALYMLWPTLNPASLTLLPV